MAMATDSCAALTTQGSVWTFCPSLGADVLFCVLFALTTVAHIAQMIWYKKWYSSVIVISAALQTTSYIIRGINIQQPSQSTLYIIWFVLMMIAPIWLNAYVYMVLGRMIYNFTTEATLLHIKAWTFGMIFVVLDIIAFFVQVIGAIVAASSSIMGGNLGSVGLDIYMGGCGFQQLCILGFLTYTILFHKRLRSISEVEAKRRATILIFVEYIIIVLITTRVVFRLVQYSQGFKSDISNHEAYEYALDSLPMFAGLVLLNIYHPGRLMPGREADIPSHKTRRMAARNGSPMGGRLAESKYTLVENPQADE
ncbi:hypothetical protein DM02DRAFT_690747 [Periconia macrospinosa]|uniref:RTA1-domain-containing protein n=1 Tax=Periconia macrospinosa TaxID=97972 RepID=A0A2V1ED24_9PLEO|nr:hypothetical protein DM02DRAFT_690747 [Periconia macrospinosa]